MSGAGRASRIPPRAAPTPRRGRRAPRGARLALGELVRGDGPQRQRLLPEPRLDRLDLGLAAPRSSPRGRVIRLRRRAASLSLRPTPSGARGRRARARGGASEPRRRSARADRRRVRPAGSGRLRRSARASRRVACSCPATARAPVAQVDDARREAVDERAVVRDEDDRAREVLQRLLEGLARVEVEMVRGLVEEEQVVALPHHDRQRQPPLLSAGEAGDGARRRRLRGTRTAPGTPRIASSVSSGCWSQTASIARRLRVEVAGAPGRSSRWRRRGRVDATAPERREAGPRASSGASSCRCRSRRGSPSARRAGARS